MGIFISLLSAFAAAADAIFRKRLTDFHPYVVAFVTMVSAIPGLALMVTLFSEWYLPSRSFWMLLFFLIIPLEMLLFYLTTTALRLAPISLIAPLSSLTSIFLIPVGFFLLGERVGLVGGFGVLAIVGGAFLLSFTRDTASPRTGRERRGVFLALIGAVVASVTISLAKMQFQYADPLLSAFYTIAALALVLIPFAKFTYTPSRLQGRGLGYLGALSAVSIGFHYIGLSLLPAVYFTSIKRLSIIFEVVSGRFLFQEHNILRRLAASFLVVAGILLIALD